MTTFHRMTGALGVLLTLVGSTPVLAQVSPQERQALIALYDAAGGNSWKNKEGWLGEAGTECDWHGVNCREADSGQRYVHSLFLVDNELVGNLPGALAELAGLRELRLNDNHLAGPIPAAFGEFASLEYLELSDNDLDGPIPGSLLSESLLFVNVVGNRLSGYTEAASPVASGRWLRFSGNPLGELPPPSWRSDDAIGLLELARTGLTGEIDLGHQAWAGLQELDLAGNAITSLAGIDPATLIDLQRLDLADNALMQQWPVTADTLPSLTTLDLSGNGLMAAPPAGLSDHPSLRELQLARNSLTADGLDTLFSLPSLRRIRLAHNPLQALPDTLPDPPAMLGELDLAGTQLSGPAPSWFGELSLRTLNLSGNRLSGSIMPWLAALRDDLSTRADLSRNEFSGELPGAVTEIEFADDGLALCWNRFDQPFDPALVSFLESAHRAGNLAECNDRQRVDIDPTVSGSWYDPDRSGTGYSVMLLGGGEVLHYWFGFPARVDSAYDEQMWSVQTTPPEGFAAVFPPSLVPFGGRFGLGLDGGYVTTYGDRALEMVRLPDRLSVYSGWWIQGRQVAIDPPPPRLHERREHVRLSELAGTTCATRTPFQEYSGAWYDPERSGEGFIVEVLPDDRAVVYWFTYTPDSSGRQAWMVGDGVISGPAVTASTPATDSTIAEVEIEHLIQPVGTVLGPGFDSGEIDHVVWGSLRLEFYGEERGRVFWESMAEGYGSGEYPIERLARPKLADCD